MEFLHKEITSRSSELHLSVPRTRYGFLERVYQGAMKVELITARSLVREWPIEVRYKEIGRGKYVADFRELMWC